ncbi:elongation factor 3 [Cryptococcus wingfieldii CBS 7118]|uniref:Elongation factor 3 n=1 Tax=Cryptococcus wingfieldii CBS 7118 TaxID=1295528 RepID=A0A1E3J306_9TREE|nr:elongation factor 3 [Cryptococcus wingfieldii CBS 7118]ODN95233.1 elongation factor 3 [Cryptococcus wingfieldii CBS 7118]
MSLIGRFEHLPNRPKSDQARPLLEKIASQVKPIMSKRGWKVGTLAEFLPADPSLLGINTNRGQRINLRLRPPGAEDTFYEYDQLVLVMLHELTHIVHGPHAAPFYTLLKELEEEYYALKTKGYSGDGFHSDGHHLGAVRRNEYDGKKKGLAAAEERLGRAKLLGKGGKLGGSGSAGKSMKELVAEAAERRLKDDKVCKTEEHSDEAEKEVKKAQEESIGVDAGDLPTSTLAPTLTASTPKRPASKHLEKEPVASGSATTPIVIDSSPEPKDLSAPPRHSPPAKPKSIIPRDWSLAPSFDLTTLFAAEKPAREEAGLALAEAAKKAGVEFFAQIGFVDAIVKALNDKKSQAAREGACEVIQVLADNGAIQVLEPYVVSSAENGIFPNLLEAFADKVTPVKVAAVAAVSAVVKHMNHWAAFVILPSLLNLIRTSGKWQIKVGCLDILQQLVKAAPYQTGEAMPQLIPVLAEAVWDTKSDVKKAAKATLEKACALVENKDIEKFVPALIKSLLNPIEEVPKTITLLSATTFVSEVTAPTISLIAPLLIRGLDERPTATKRKVCVIADNMSKLVDSEYTVRPFLPRLLPGLIKTAETIADPEARSVANRAIVTLRRIGKVPAESDGSDLPPLPIAEGEHLATNFVALFQKHGGVAVEQSNPGLAYAGVLAASLVNHHNFDQKTWESTLPAYLKLAAPSYDSLPAVRELLQKKADEAESGDEKFADEEEGEDLCNIEQFNLAYGAKILLHHATMRLKRGHRYGLCGRNGSGKSTLMNAIINSQVEGFPPPTEVRTFYVQHDIDGSEAEISIIDWVLADKRLQATPEEIKSTLESVGFDEVKQKNSIGSLSGGWKMKLALARAILFKADILLLDEPTNHLDVLNVDWLINYLTSLTHCTSIIVSHDSDFLNRTVTDVLHLNNFKLKRYPGNLEAFVQHVPEAKSYYQLDVAEDYQFKLPAPPLLDGVKTKEKSLLKMRNVSFQYPGSAVQQLYDINLQVSLSSRVAILGPNGSGKSTLVKLLTGETEPNLGGQVWKHPNLVIGYVAQHAFHHIDMHLDSTPLEYMLWRYQTGEDLEEMNKATRVMTEEEIQKMKEGATVIKEGVKRFIEEVVARKKLKQSYEYEVTFKGLSSAENMWFSRDELVGRGFEKKVIELDTREAQRLGLMRPLVRREIEKHMEDFGLDSEFVSHNSMRGLSGGQKVKVVLGAATWRRPHIICLDEPTNYLDRESLAALIAALKNFEGGVLIITHNREFSESICSEVWAMRDGYLEASGHNWVEGQGSGERIDKKADGEEEVKYDALGNPIAAAKKEKKLSAADKRKAKKDRMARRKRGEEVYTDEE